MLDRIVYGGEGVLALVALYLVWKALTAGVPAAWAVISGWWNWEKTLLATLEADVTGLKTDVVALGAKVGVATVTTPPPAPPAPPVPPAPVAPAPATPAAGLQ